MVCFVLPTLQSIIQHFLFFFVAPERHEDPPERSPQIGYKSQPMSWQTETSGMTKTIKHNHVTISKPCFATLHPGFLLKCHLSHHISWYRALSWQQTYSLWIPICCALRELAASLRGVSPKSWGAHGQQKPEAVGSTPLSSVTPQECLGLCWPMSHQQPTSFSSS